LVALAWEQLDDEDDESFALWAAMVAELPHEGSPFLGLVDAARPWWHAKAACRDHPELDWFAAADQEATTAVCADCPASAECAEAGLSEPYGLWGGQAHRMVGTGTTAVRSAPRAPSQAPRLCSNCGSAPARARGLCSKCYQYRRWSGRDRPEHLIVADNIRRHEAEVVACRDREATLRAEEAVRERAARLRRQNPRPE